MASFRSKIRNTGPYQKARVDSVDGRKPINGIEALRYRPPKMDPEHYDRSPTMETDGNVPSATNRRRSIRLDEEEALKAYLFERLELLQQQALKRIAKAWIKAICPRKQSIFPYRVKSDVEGEETKPGPHPE